jgi:hypothetical protein
VPSFLHGDATAGDVLSMQQVRAAPEGAGVPRKVAWSPLFRPGTLTLDDAAPERYAHVDFVCGPLHGQQVRWLHGHFARCRRIAVGVTVDPSDPTVTGLDVVLARNAGARPPGPARLPRAAPRRGGHHPAPRPSAGVRHGVLALAVDQVAGAGKVSAQAHAWQWPALVAAESVVRDRRGTAELQDWWRWSCRRRAGSSTWRAQPAPRPLTSWW